jgi:hypothetical protein
MPAEPLPPTHRVITPYSVITLHSVITLYSVILTRRVRISVEAINNFG